MALALILCGACSGDPGDAPQTPGGEAGAAAAAPGQAGQSSDAPEPSDSASAAAAGANATDDAVPASSGSGGVTPRDALCFVGEGDGAELPEVPMAFVSRCAGCHSADPTSATPFPNLFQYDGDSPAWRSRVRDGGQLMPAFDDGLLSDDELVAIERYFASARSLLQPCTPSPQECAPPRFEAQFAPAELPAIVEQREDGVRVTHGAGRVRGRHELEGEYGPFGARYFENRSFAFSVEDTVAAGGSTVRVTYRPEAPVSAFGSVTNFRHFKVYGDGNVFHRNVFMEQTSPRELYFVVRDNGREGRAMAPGDVLEFEFGIFIAGNGDGDPDAIEGRTAYYSDTFRYRVGEGGLSPDNHDDSGVPGPAPDAALAGDTTIPWLYAEPELYFSQMALNIQPEHVQPFLRGRRLFHTDFGDGQHSEAGNPAFDAQAGKLGPLFSARACVDCHPRDGRGQAPEPGGALQSMAVKLYGAAELGNQLQSQEGQASLERYEAREVSFADGTTLPLRRPVFRVDASGGSPPARSIRVARQLPGMGLLEAVDDATILEWADAADCDADGISGRAQPIADPREPALLRLGRFGWKAEKVSVAHQVADALEADLGVTSPLIRDADGQAELQDDDYADLVTYARLLALPGQRDAQAPEVREGERLFGLVGCTRCHRETLTTGDDHPFAELRGQSIRPFTDLLLHDMGPDLADESGTAQASEWRTPPLWGLGLIEVVSGHAQLLHDGRARDPLEAILWHGGEAAFAREAVLHLDATERAALLAFLGSL